MGLLDDPAMNFGIGLMAAGGPSRMPVSLGQGIAQGFQQAQQAEAQQQRRAMEEMRLKMFEQQMMQQKAAQEAEMRKRLALQSYLQNVPEQLRPLAGAFPEEVGKHMLGTMFAKPQGPIKLGAEETLIDPQTYQPIATGKGKEAALPWYVRKDPSGKTMIDPAYADFEKAKAASGRPASPYFTPVPTTNGLGRFDNRTGKFELVDGGGITKPQDNPKLQGQIAEEKKYGQERGEQRSMLQGKQDALDSVREAKRMLDAGIYSGGYAELKMMGAKMIPGISTDTAARTEEFRSYIGNTVIPRLKEFGGNDSNEEMRYLQKVMGGEITMEGAALKRILADSERKIQRGINNLKMHPQQANQPAPQQGGAKFLGFE